MSDLDESRIAELKARMEAELSELLEMSAARSQDAAPVQLDQQSVGRLSRIDAMQVQAMAVASGRRRTARINSLKAALERVASGEYGYCTSCEESIAAGRLGADPTLRLCLSCARQGGS